jgi:hypothetical protein
MIHDIDIIDRIERASDARPTCPCGWHTTVVWRDGTIWLECASLSAPDGGFLRRFVGTLIRPMHVHTRIADVPAAASAGV